jgi:hypothetical protein
MKAMTLVTPYVLGEDDTGYHAAVTDDYRTLAYKNLQFQHKPGEVPPDLNVPPVPNLHVCLVVVSDETAGEIEKDGKYITLTVDDYE